MSDVVLAAGIAGAVGLLGSAGTLIVTRWNLVDQARQREAQALGGARQRRQKVYGQLAWLLGRLQKYDALGFPPDQGEWMDWLDQYSYRSSLVMIVGSRPVVAGVRAFGAALEKAAPDMRSMFAPDVEIGRTRTWAEAYGAHKAELNAKIDDLLLRMRTDVAPDQ